jgi:multiple sugar transport system substrate-binding protein
MWPGAMDDFISSGGLLPMDMFVDFKDYMKDRVPEDLLPVFKAFDGHYYQLPWKTNPVMIVYNKDLFEEAGVQAPLKTYSEYLKAAAKLTRDRDGDGRIDQWMSFRDIKPIWWQRLFDYYPLYIAASGGKTLFKSGAIDFNNLFSVEVFRFLQTAYTNKYFPITDFQGDKFLSKQLATQITGAYFIAYIKQYSDIKLGIMPLPVPDVYNGEVYTLGDFKNISIFSSTKHPRQAWLFAKSLISPQADLGLLQTCSQIPVRKNLTSDSMFAEYFRQQPEMRAFAEQAVRTRAVDSISDLKEVLDIISQEYESSVIYSYLKPEEAVKQAAERVKVIMDWNRE